MRINEPPMCFARPREFAETSRVAEPATRHQSPFAGNGYYGCDLGAGPPLSAAPWLYVGCIPEGIGTYVVCFSESNYWLKNAAPREPRKDQNSYQNSYHPSHRKVQDFWFPKNFWFANTRTLTTLPILPKSPSRGSLNGKQLPPLPTACVLRAAWAFFCVSRIAYVLHACEVAFPARVRVDPQ